MSFYEYYITNTYHYKSVDEYYKQIDIDEKQIKHIRTKTLILHARDDLVVTSQQLPINQLLENPNIILVQTKSGGHVCWYEGLNPIQRVSCAATDKTRKAGPTLSLFSYFYSAQADTSDTSGPHKSLLKFQS